MKKAAIALWVIFAVSVLIFWIAVFTASTASTWEVFSVAMPISGISFTGAVILTIIDNIRSKKSR